MLGLFKKKSPSAKLEKQYKKLMEESYKLSHIDRKAADKKYAEAEEVSKQIQALKTES